mgnify:CR=1 FL=1
MGYFILGVVGLIVLLFAVCVIRVLLAPKGATIQVIPEVDPNRAVAYGEKLSQLIQVETVSSVESDNLEKFYGFQKVMETQFPRIHEVCEKHDFRGSVLFKWKGLASDRPILVMNHFDVVEASGKWRFPPFSGTIAEGKVYGRGALDDKGPFFVMYQGIEELIESGFVPNQDVYIASTCTEEIGGEGAGLIADYLDQQGLQFDFLLDEGGMIVDEPLPGLKGLYAMVGVVEKGNGDVKFIARGHGGHASAPGKQTPLVRLGEFMASVEKHYPLKSEVSSTLSEMIRRLSPQLPFMMRLVTENLWLFKPVITQVAKLNPSLAAMTRTTVAFTTAKGSDGFNVLPQEAYVTANIRYSPHQAVEETHRILQQRAKKYNLELEVIQAQEPAPVVDYQNKPFQRIEATIASLYPGLVITPYIMTGATDARFYNHLTKDGIRFAPLKITTKQMETIHGIDENIDLSSLPLGVDFYKELIKGL